MRKANDALFIDNDTGIGQVLSSSEFELFIAERLDIDGLSQEYVYDAIQPLWSQASMELASRASGDVITISPYAKLTNSDDFATVFSSVELPELLANPNVTSIDGISRLDLVNLHNSALSQALSGGATAVEAAEIARKEVLDIVSGQSLSNMKGKVEFGATGGIKVAAEFFPDGTPAATSGINSISGEAAFAFDEVAKPLADSDLERLAKTATFLKGAKVAGTYAGPIGDLLEIAAAAVTIKHLYDIGDKEGVARETAKVSTSLLAGAAGSAAAAELLSPMLLGGPIGITGYVILVGAAGVASSVAGENVVDLLFSGGSGVFYGRDGMGLFVDIYTRDANGQLRVSRARQRIDSDEIRVGTFDPGEQGEIVVTANRDGTVRSAYVKFRDPVTGEGQFLVSGDLLGEAANIFRDFLDRLPNGDVTLIGGGRSGGGSWGGSDLAAGDSVAQTPSGRLPAYTVVRNSDGTISVNGRLVQGIAQDPRNPDAALVSVPVSSEISIEAYIVGGKLYETGVVYHRDGDVIVKSGGGEPTTIRLANSEIGIDFVNASQTIANVFGRYFIGGDALTQTLSSAVISTLSANFGDVLNTLVFDSGENTISRIEQAFGGIGEEFLTDLQQAGLGTLSAMITAELIDQLGIEGIPGQAVGSLANYTLSVIADNIADIIGGGDSGVFDGIGSEDFLNNLGNVAGSFIGSTLANEIASWDEVGEQIGSSIGTSLGSLVGQTTIPVPVLGAAIGSLLGNLLGGLIGGIFTGTPKSGAIVQFDEENGTFLVSQVWKEDGGKRAAARELGNMAASSMNGIIDKIGGTLVNGTDIETGSYGMRGKRYVYWEDDFSSENRVKFKEARDLIEYGVMKAASDFQFLGGDVYLKRAFFATMASGYKDSTNADDMSDPDGLVTNVDFGLDVLLGNLAVADRLKTYLALSSSVNALIAAEPNSVFTADWLLTFSRISDLGLFKRNEHDWDGGFAYLVNQAEVDARDVRFRFETIGGDRRNGERAIYLGNQALDDTIDTRSKTIQEGTSASEIIKAGNSVSVATVVRAGAGDDIVIGGNTGDDLFGEDGNDRLIGGTLDDWLFGGNGNDVLWAGTGSGNVLSGDAGNDYLTGADGAPSVLDEGSDWLNGGAGDDSINGRGGGDFLEGGRGNDRLDGGEGSDTAIYRIGDGIDLISDTGLGAADRDTLEFGHGIEQNEISVVARSAGEALLLFVGEMGGGDRLDLRGVSFGTVSGIDQVSFETGAWSRSDLISRAIFSKNAGQNVIGNATDEQLSGTIHDDRLSGGGGNDQLAGRFGSDIYVFDLGGGDDIISDIGYAADVDVLEFGVGISAGDIAVTWSAAAQRDIKLTIAGGQGSVTLAAQSLSEGENAIEEVRFVDGTSWTLRDIFARILLVPTSGADVVEGTPLDEQITGLAGNDQLRGGLGDDHLDGGDGSDTYYYNLGDGHDRITDDRTGDGGSVNRLVFGAGITTSNIILVRDPADEYDLRVSFAGHEGSLVLNNQFYTSDWRGGRYDWGFDAIEFADGTVWNRAQLFSQLLAADSTANNDSITGSRYADILSGGTGNDLISAGEGNDQLTGGQGNDYLDGSWGSDTYFYNLGDGHDQIYDERKGDGGSVNRLVLGAGITTANIVLVRDPADANHLRISFAGHEGSITLRGQFYTQDYQGARYDMGFDAIEFADGTVWDRTQLFSQLLAADSTGNKDGIIGSRYADILSGGGGNDLISAGEGNDQLTGGQGNDYLDGGYGSDTYFYNLGDGHDRLHDERTDDGSSVNRLVLGAGITTSNIIFARDPANANNMLIGFAGHEGSIVLEGQLYTQSYRGALYDWGFDAIEFADGTVWNRAQIFGQLLAADSTASGDGVTGSRLADIISTGAGNDTISAGEGDDQLIGGSGHDFLAGGTGSDTYLFNLGDGQDVILESTGTATDAIQFGPGIAAADVTISRISDDLLLRITGTSDQILIRNGANTSYAIEEIRFADGTIWNHAAVLASAALSAGITVNDTNAATVINGAAKNDRLFGNGGIDRLIGGAGDDHLSGGNDADTYVFNLGDGRDVISDNGSGVDRIEFGAGIGTADVIVTLTNDGADFLLSIGGTTDQIQIVGGNGSGAGNIIEEVHFANGAVWSRADMLQRATLPTASDDRFYGSSAAETIEGQAGDDSLWGNAGADRLIGGTGDDYLSGGTDSDTYVFNLGDGRDAINEGGSGTDKIEFGVGIAASDVIVTQLNDGADFLLSIAGTNDQIQIIGGNGSGAGNIVEEVHFANGTVWSRADILQRATQPTAGDDLFHGSSTGETLEGQAGDDSLWGNAGADRMIGGAGDDYLSGGTDSDTYVFNRGDGRDAIYDNGSGVDRIEFGAGISASDVIVTQMNDGADFLLSIIGTNDQIQVIGGNASGAGNTVEEVHFVDGTVWSLTDILQRGTEPTGGDDRFYGSTSGETLEGRAGNDSLWGNAGVDRLIGGTGDDYLSGGDGADSYIFNRGDGRDAVRDYGNGVDRIEFGPGIAASDIAVTQLNNGADFLLSIIGTQDRIQIVGGNAGGSGTIEEVRFLDGTVVTLADLKLLTSGTTIGGMAQPVTMGDDEVIGASSGDTIRAMGGDDALRGGAGSDTYVFRRGDGYDTIYDPMDAAATDILTLEGVNSTDVRVLTSPTDAQDIVLYIDDHNLIYLDQQKASASSGVEEVRFADGVTWNRSDLLARSGLVPTSGNDTLIGTNFGEAIEGLGGDDILEGRAGGDAYRYALGNGNDVIVEKGSSNAVANGTSPVGADDRIIFGTGILAVDLRASHAVGNSSDILLTFSGNSGSILLKDQNKGAQVGAGIEFLEFSDGSIMSMKTLLAQSLAGVATTGVDTISGFITSDDLVGGLGNDLLAGGLGSDRYLYSLGDGVDTLLEYSASTDTDELIFGAGISSANLSLRRRAESPNDLVLLIGTGGDEIRLVNQLAGTSGQGVELVRFHDGTTWSRDQLLAYYGNQPATSDGDFIMGGDTDNLFAGLGGGDIIDGGAGDDTLNGGDGNDDLRGGRGEDILNGGDGDDILSGGTGADEFDGGAGFDTLDYSFSLDDWSINLTTGTASIVTSGAAEGQELFTGIEAVVGGMGRDQLTGNDLGNRLEGDENDDVLSGVGGDDIFVYRGSEAGLDTVNGGSGHDRIEAAENDTVIGLASIDSIEEISASGFTNVSITGTDEADILDFSATAVDGISQVYLAAGDDVFTGSGGFAVVDLGLGNDVYKVSGNYGAAGVVGGDGLDRIEAIAGNSVIGLSSIAGIEQISAGSHANVIVAGSNQADTLNFAAVSLTGILRIEGGDGADTITGSAQSDVIRGGAGDDILSGGDGDDIFEITSATDGADTINGGNGTDQLRVTASGLAIRLAAPPVGVEAIYGMSSQLIFGGTNDNINLSGIILSGITSIDGGAGADTIVASAGADQILAGLGNDTLTGNGGDDTYVFNLGDGQDVILEYVSTSSGGSGGLDALVFGAGILADDVSISRSGNDIILTIGSTGEKVTIKNQASSTTSYWVEEVRFADGTIWDRATTIGTALYGTAAADTLIGTSAADTIFGLDGNDMITGAAGADRLYGGNGNDTINGGAADDGLYGGAGDDIFQYGAAGDGYDYVSGGDGNDLIVATANNSWIGLRSISGIEAISSGGFSNVAVWGSTGADILSFAGITLTGITKIDAYDGNDILIGSSGADNLVGGAGNDRITGGLGNDTIDGGSGTDTADYSAEANGWTINLAASSNHAQSGTETDTLISIENVIGGAGTDTISGTTAANVLDGGDGNDVLRGNAGNDTLIGGAGNDIAVFAGLQASYSITTSAGAIQIVDNQASVDGNDGTDTLSGIETAEFKNGVQVSLSSPIVLDLDGNGAKLIDRSLSTARFDWTGDGIRDATGWISSGDGFLTLDRDGDGTVTDARELSFVDDKYGAKSDLDGLSAFDTNGDGLLSVADQAWGSFHVWKDANGDGVVGTGEYLSMSQAGIRSINLAGTATEQSWGWNDNVVVNTGGFTRLNGSTAALSDVALSFVAGNSGDAGASDKAPSSSEGDVSNMALRSEMRALRDIRGARQYFGAIDGSGRHMLHRPEIFDVELWSGGSARIDVDSNDRGTDMDQRLAAMIQDMASFGAQPAGEMSKWSRGNDPILEFFA
ncbi:calcium-binding protein [Sphingopyxis sp. H081]|nr:calcium-binding protein [Sphingopyxis sp. H081]